MATFENEFVLKVTLKNQAETEEVAKERSLSQIGNIQANLSNQFTRTS